nr:crotonase/enoyl-CoA hydratase family protein [uncultured Noviherbaspirillum sp.]
MGAPDIAFSLLNHVSYSHIELQFDKSIAHTLWVTMKKNSAQPAHHFSLPLLHELRDVGRRLQAGASRWHHDGAIEPVNYAVLRSGHPDYFSLGGDLRLFRTCIRKRDKASLLGYARLCIDMMVERNACSNPGMSTISLVQGRALGGGFEAALAADYLVAEEQSTFGFPEILFGLFPCTGAMSLLTRRVPVHQAQRLMTSGKLYSAYALHAMGLVDEVCSKGDGVTAVERHIARHAHRRVRRAVERTSPLDLAELQQVVEDWVELALGLKPEALRVMDMLISMQHRRSATGEASAIEDFVGTGAGGDESASL